ncbi:tripartite tricarboxylate transporter substrate binding protein [Polynucleobacter sp. UK-Mo-2m-Kol15]|uniref:Bug family tripartite tricarboxylate transporter substrate binding protein n=1 Tax=Polynucleobacter sp. UK-Mo-2m-Kol15 TaxID=2576916 RepID=UPI001C0C99D8|nr:tripartite tricarboxylate transporter substrate binding protein [Polynucleobacter sp. UK-Mo-2m-Kol15]MBU3575315.1 tripartite tricarboxylate transporter substrate binding protein [Polynucleobacter sp. UK-Mo-2m-Kol15]
MKNFIVALFCVPLLALTTGVNAQQNYPQRTIRLIVPFAPGGASDFSARIISQALSEELKQSVVIDNKGGAAGNIGMEAAARATPDGYTLFFGNVGTISINPSVFGATLKVKPAEDFIPITKVVDVPSVLVVNSEIPSSTVKEFVNYAKTQKRELNFGSSGSGSLNSLEMLSLMKEAKINMTQVPYKSGAGQAITNLIGGQIDVMFVTLPSAIGYIKSNKIKALAVTSTNRLEQLPSVPTLIEQGYPSRVSSSWQGIFAPRDTPPEIVNTLFTALTKVLAQKSVQEKLATSGTIAAGSPSPEAFGAYVKAETSRWGKAVREIEIELP